MLTGREKVLAALAGDGTPELPAVLCYEDIFYRDHWQQLTACPWWYVCEPDIDRQAAWRRDVAARIDQDWFVLPVGASRAERENTSIEVRADGVYRCDRRSASCRQLEPPRIGGSPIDIHGAAHSINGPDDIERLIPLPAAFNPAALAADGRRDLADTLRSGIHARRAPLVHVASPLWACVMLWGFESLMTTLVDNPELIRRACERFYLQQEQSVAEAAILGAEVIWIEECMTDMVSPEVFRRSNLPYVTSLVEAIRGAGMRSVYYYCGSPAGKLELILAAGADAISLEESKKGFRIDIDEVVDAVRGRCTLLGNLDAINLLPRCSEAELRAEITRQLAAGRRNNNRFIMSLGSPVTPGTFVPRVALYCDLVHELGR